MINTQGVLDSITAMQQNAQAALPVIPNNGNPQGANNMPTSQPTQLPVVAGPRPTEHYYPWMAPSPAFGTIQGRLQGMQKPMIIPQPIATAQPPVVQPPAIAQPSMQQAGMPVLPQEAGARRTQFGTWEQPR